MSRKARQRSLTGMYHVIQRGLDHMNIFQEDDDRQMFLNLLKQQVSDEFRIYCYCLMDNHTHLLVKSDELSPYIQRISSMYAMWFNQKYKRTGYLFQDRFKSEIIEDETYFLCCFRYILQNPVKAGICTKVSSYRWSSYQAYYNNPLSFVYTEFIPSFFETENDLNEYLGINQNDSCLDIDQRKMLTDDEVQKILNQKLNGKIFAELSADKQKQILREMKNTTGTGLRQLARITNTNYALIQRL